MRQFFKFMIASMFGFIFGAIVLLIILVGIIGVAVSSMGKEEETKVKSNSVLFLELDKPIVDRASRNPFENLDLGSFDTEGKTGLNTILEQIAKAKNDDNINGIYMELTTLNAGIASVEEIRKALLDFKKSGKPVLCYSENYTQKSYYLASAANTIMLNPQGSMELKGLGAEIMFYKGLLDKIEVQTQVIRHGRYKSAVEPFILDKMSDDNRKQTHSFISSIWQHIIGNISLARKIPVQELQNLTNNYSLQEANDAIKFSMVDKLCYKDEVIAKLNELSKNKDKTAKPSLVNLSDYVKAPADKPKHLKDPQIAVIYASGEIESGKGDNGTIGSETLSKAIREARLNKKVKAVVLRVNSPGGSALASEVIWREVELTNQVKPIVVSMGDVAASGGYYISAAGRKIFASPNTITGSIGVFGLVFNAQKMLNNKLGITIDTVKTNSMSDFGSMSRPLTAEEKTILQKSVEQVYDTFTKRVAAGRKIPQHLVDSIGQGRVWSGAEAKSIGLIDEFGGLDDAIKEAAKMAKAPNYRIIELPEAKDPFEEIISQLSNDAESSFLQNKLGDEARYFNKTAELLKMKGIQTRLPYDIDFY